MFEFAKEALDLVALAVELFAEAGFPFAVGFGRGVGQRALSLDQAAHVASVIGFVSQHDGARSETLQQAKRGRPVVRLA